MYTLSSSSGTNGSSVPTEDSKFFCYPRCDKEKTTTPTPIVLNNDNTKSGLPSERSSEFCEAYTSYICGENNYTLYEIYQMPADNDAKIIDPRYVEGDFEKGTKCNVRCIFDDSSNPQYKSSQNSKDDVAENFADCWERAEKASKNKNEKCKYSVWAISSSAS